MQLIQLFKKILDKEYINIYLRPYEIMITSANSGILGIFYDIYIYFFYRICSEHALSRFFEKKGIGIY